jgi:hypothetical protein
MAEVVQGTQQEFWRPPSPILSADPVILHPAPPMAEACPRCSTEFLSGSHFCHSCGGRRPELISPATKADAAALAGLWEQVVDAAHAGVTGWNRIEFPGWLRYLHFHEIKKHAGLSTASLIAFILGLGCVAGALLVGLLNAKTLVDWEAIQFYRVEWLLAAVASFAAGILLKKRSSEEADD